jgi:hypothetical protein
LISKDLRGPKGPLFHGRPTFWSFSAACEGAPFQSFELEVAARLKARPFKALSLKVALVDLESVIETNTCPESLDQIDVEPIPNGGVVAT